MRRPHPPTGDPGQAMQDGLHLGRGQVREQREVGELSRRFAPAFEGMTVHCTGGQTAITGVVVDQSQLHGLLDRVGELGLELVSVNAVGDEDR